MQIKKKKKTRKKMKEKREIKDLFLGDSVQTKAYPLLSEVTFQACYYKINSIKSKHASIKLHCAILQQRDLKFCIQFWTGKRKSMFKSSACKRTQQHCRCFVFSFVCYFPFRIVLLWRAKETRLKYVCNKVDWNYVIFHTGGRRKICALS